jgi:hypothetical protein
MSKNIKTELVETAEGTDVVVNKTAEQTSEKLAAEKELDAAIDEIVDDATAYCTKDDAEASETSNPVQVEFIASPMGFNLSYNVGDVATLTEGQARLLEAKKIVVIL